MEKTYRESEFGSVSQVSSEPIMVWKVHLLREQPRKLLFILPVVVLSMLVCLLIFRSPLLLAVTVFLYLSSLADYLFPVRYEIDEKGASSRSLVSRTVIPWDRVKKYYLDDRGIKLSPLEHTGRLEAFRGVYLKFGDNREEVIAAVRRMRDAERARETVS